MIASESAKNVMQAIQFVQQGADGVSKGSQGQVGTRNYKYAGLNEVWETVKPLLKQAGLVVTQSPSIGDRGQSFVTTIYHVESGEYVTEQMPFIVQREDPQGIGSAITYYRRYMLMSMLGLVSDEDSDAKEHRLATAQQKLQIVGAVKAMWAGETPPTPQQIISTVTDVVGKHPSQIREDEAGKCIDLITAFGSKS